jgi:hypothetical protein
LVVGVGIDDDVGAEAQTIVDAGLIGVGEASPGRVADDMIDAGGTGDGHGIVGAAVVDEQDLDHINARDLAGDIADHLGNGFCFIERRDLDDELHDNLRLCKKSNHPIIATINRDLGAGGAGKYIAT